MCLVDGNSSYTLLTLPPLVIASSHYFPNLSKAMIPLFVLASILYVDSKPSNAIGITLNGAMPALVIAIASLVCILAAAIRRYKVALLYLGLLYLGLSVGIFVTRSMISTFFDDTMIIE